VSKIRIAFASTYEMDIYPLVTAVKELSGDMGEIAEVCLRSGDDLRDTVALEEFIRFVSGSHLLIINLHGGKNSLGCFDELHSAAGNAGVPVHAQSSPGENDIELIRSSTVDEDDYKKIWGYLKYGGKDNFRGLLLYAASRFAGSVHPVPEVVKPPYDGVYHPDFDHVPSLDEYLEKKCVDGRPTVGIWFYQNFWQAGNTRFIDSLIAETERQGANVIPLFMYSYKDADLGTKGAEWAMENYFMRDGKPIIDVLISPLMFSLSMSFARNRDAQSGDDVFLKKLGVPVIKAIMTNNTYAEWRDSFQGLSPIDISVNIAMPEFDGMLITVPIASREKVEVDPLTGARMVRFEPIEERVNKIIRLSLNWAKLRHIPNKEKKVAIIFHNYPPRDDQIGAAFGLDSPVSVLNILRDLRDAGYTVERLPESGRELIDDVKSRVTNDRRWSSPAEMAKRAIDTVSAEQYEKWLKELPEEVEKKMREAWGVLPGELFAHNGKLIIPGIINGNIFIGLQPPRGLLEAPAAIYHSPDLPIPYHYHAYYRWIRDVFGACLVMHIGTHGSLEWLPGKSAGLSASCYPDITISDLPNIYPYIINNPGEGTQAKRRSYCCIIDHLIPVMHNADAYDEMAEIDTLLRDYNHAVAENPSKVPDLRKTIWEKVCEAKLNHDLGTDETTAFADFEGFREKLHDYLHEVADTQIRDGLHTLGVPPADARLDEFLVALTRLKNGSTPSLRETLAEVMGYDYDDLLARRGKIVDGMKTGGEIITHVHELSHRLITRFHEAGFNPECIRATEEEIIGGRSQKVEKIMEYIATFLVPGVAATADELRNILSASQGGFILPGPSGSPTRGMADILPTGRNFYSIDPRAIPTPAAWKVGVAQAESLLDRYLKDEGRYPETIGIVIWGTPTMRTKGDDIAEVFYLMGVKPRWESRSGRVEGLEIIPLEELGRPRIDVTLRISGFFRDSFPNLVHLIDEAVEMVAGLNEPPEMNYLARNVARDVEEKIAQGADPEQARNESMYRLFGCRPGTYGAGVSDAIDSKNWKDEKDLAEIYVTWGGYAYGRKTYGLTVPEEFKRRLSRMDMAVKNQDTREYDMLDSDDFYSYHGGMITAVRVFKGEAPRAYIGDSADPDRIKTRSTAEEAKHVFRSRILNPKWIESMKRHGYAGAADMSRMVDIAFGWDATAEVIDDWMYEALADKYALDRDMQDWLKDVNPHALQNITERLLEAIERDMWNATDEMKQELQDIYLDIEGVLEGE
jgi:cobaltochelatase CobN